MSKPNGSELGIVFKAAAAAGLATVLYAITAEKLPVSAAVSWGTAAAIIAGITMQAGLNQCEPAGNS